MLCLWLAACAAAASAQTDVRPVVSVADTLAFRQIEEVRMAPDGSAIAFVTRAASLDRRRNEESLMIVDARGERTRTLITADDLTAVSWDGASRALYALREADGARAIVRVHTAGGAVDEIWRAPAAIDRFAISPDGSRCLVAMPVESAPEVAQQRIDYGLVFEYGRHTGQTILRREYADVEWLQLVLIDAVAGTSRTVARLPYEGFRHLGFVDRMAISPDNRTAAIELVRAGKPSEGGAPFNHDIGLLDLESGAYAEPMPGSLQGEMSPVWLGDSQRLFFTSDGRGTLYNLATRSLEQPDWARAPANTSWVTSATYDPAQDAVYVLARRLLLRFAFRSRTVEDVATIYQAPSFNADFSKYAFVSETSSDRPEVAVFDMRGGKSTRLTDLNPYLDGRSLGRVEPIEVTNASGVTTNGYLVYPVGYKAGQRHPLIVATYGFQGKFILTAEWHTTFPAQALAGEGYAVLLLNRPSRPSAQVTVGDPVRARDNEGWQVLSAFEAAIDLLVAKGIADRENVGLYGWSHGAFIVEFILAHSKRRFTAASIGEGGDYNPGGYWMFGNRGWPAIYVNTFGGPFTRRTAPAYLEFSPVLSVDRVRTPLLMEFVTENGQIGLEFYVPLREARVPAELVLYEGEEHNFVKPTVRFASMHRKIDWFNFWMRDKRDPAAEKREQYARWTRLQAEWNR